MSEVDEFVDELQRGLSARLPDPSLADRILKVRFTPTRLRRGYDMSQVDEFLDVARAAAAGGPGAS